MSIPELCWSCDYWEPVPMLNREGMKLQQGHCALFDKITDVEHGSKCTAWIRGVNIESPKNEMVNQQPKKTEGTE